MLSVVLYGRNDSHGYNLHKRAAISFNCIAEVLDDPDDELIFVDYNTPNDLPTFPEAIADTLTARCRQRLRILRIRPDLHEVFRDCTHLVALESVSRNAAIRRANPANRWVLSTNTDMVFVPRDGVGSLSAAVADLPDGFYGLPRFDMPQALWESVDRADPAGTIDLFRHWGRRFHINEVVHGNPLIRFDGPGDFQLMTRDDIAAIHGFHEGMLRGWHVDSNLCKRMLLLRGAIGTLDHRVLGYHCDHSRQATLANRAAKVENDPQRFVFGVETPFIPEQADTWGLPGAPVEEVRLAAPGGGRCVAALERALPAAGPDRYEAVYREERYNDLSYVPEHVLPFVVDHLMTLPADADIAYVGCRADAFALFRRGWEALGFTGRLLVDERMAVPAAGDADGRVCAWPLDRIADHAGAFFFEFGCEAPQPFDEAAEAATLDGLSAAERCRVLNHRRLLAVGEAGLSRLGRVRAAFHWIARRLRRPEHRGRLGTVKVFAINAVNNAFEYSFAEEVNLTWPPFTTRLRHGYLRPHWSSVEAWPDWTGLQEFLARALGRSRPVPYGEVRMLLGDLEAIVACDHPDEVEPWRFGAGIAALARWPGLPARTGLAADGIARAASWCAQGALSVRLRPSLRLPAAAADRTEGPPLSKLCGAEDWDDAAWFALAEDYARHNAVLLNTASPDNAFKRSRGLWERVQQLWAMETLGFLRPDARAVVATPDVDGLYAYLSQVVERVDVCNTGDGEPAEWLGKQRLFERSRIAVRSIGEIRPDAAWTAAFATQNALFRDGAAGAARLLATLDRGLETGGAAACSVEVVLNGRVRRPWLLPEEVTAVVAALERHTGWRVAAPFDWSVGDATLDRTARDGTGEVRRPHLAVDSDGVLHTVGILVLRKQADTPDGGWDRFARDPALA